MKLAEALLEYNQVGLDRWDRSAYYFVKGGEIWMHRCDSSESLAGVTFLELTRNDWLPFKEKEKKQTLSDKLGELKNFLPNTSQTKCLQEELKNRNQISLIIEKEQEQVRRCEQLFKLALKEFMDWIYKQGQMVSYEDFNKKSKEIFGYSDGKNRNYGKKEW